MANIQYTHDLGHVGYSAPEGGYNPTDPTPETSDNPLKYMVNIAGALVSLLLVAGVAVWGYQLVMRDVSGIPVVRAAQGEMRVRPADPGGQLAQNTGLAVNQVAAAGEAAGPVDRLVLAPRPTQLSAEDTPMAGEMVAPVQQPAPLDIEASLTRETQAIDVAAALQGGSVEDLVNQLTAGVAAIDAGPELAPETTPAVPKPVATTVTPKKRPAITPTASGTPGPGLVRSLRPALRPASAPEVVVPASMPVPEVTTDLDPAVIPAGTRLVQLGAFESAEIARSEWDKMQGRFGSYLTGKDRIVQRAESGGRIFYRLRAHGFADLSDARRFCSALVAEGVDCIPVVTR